MLGKILVGAAGLGGIYVAATQSPTATGQAFAVPAATAIERLDGRRNIVNGTGMGSFTIASHLAHGSSKPGAITISLKRAGTPRPIICQVQVIEDGGDKSRAETDCSQPQAKKTPLLGAGVKAMELMATEHVASHIEGRAYDVDGVANRMMALAVTSMPTMIATMKPPESAR